MAKVTVRREWPDHDVLAVCVEVEGSYPDSVNEAKTQALHAYAEALGVTMADVEDDES